MARPIEISFRVEGLQQLGEKLRDLSASMQKKVSGQATGAAAGIVHAAAQSNLRTSPSIRTGLLEKNVIVKKLPRSQTDVTSEHIVTVKKVSYQTTDGNKTNTRRVGSFVEFGTINMPAEPWLRPAMDHNFNKATNVMVKRLADGINKAAGK